MSLKVNNSDIRRRYIISSSFKMAALFTLLLGVSIFLWLYAIVSIQHGNYQDHIFIISIAILFTISVVAISYLISFFVVGKINQISNTAVSIVNTQDLGRRVETTTRWDDLSNVASVFNLLLDNVEELLLNIKNVSDSIAHDLRTPLSRLRNNLYILDERFQTEETEKALKDCDMLLEIFSSLLRLNRLENGKQQLNKSKQNIRNLILDSIAMYEPLADNKEIIFEVNVCDKNFFLDKNLMFQSFANLIDNAIKFSPKKSIIIINGIVDKNCYVFEIIDNGQGVKIDNLEKIFTKLFREDKNRSHSGNGLGLALVKQVAELHNGRVWAISNQNKCEDEKGLKISLQIPIH